MIYFDEKQHNYLMKREGEEIFLAKIEEELKDCLVYKSCATIDEKVIGIFDVSTRHNSYKTILLYRDRAPVATKEFSTEIFLRYRDKYDSHFQLSKRIIKAVFKKNYYLNAFMTKKVMFIPLEGESKGNVSYLNATYIDSITASGSHESVVSFSNNLDMIMPRSITCTKNKELIYLKQYIAYSYSQICLNDEEADFKPFAYWEGSCHLAYEGLIVEVINLIDKATITDCRVRNHMKNDLKDEWVQQICEDHCDGNL